MRAFTILLFVFLLSVRIDAQVESAVNALETGPDGVHPQQAAVIHEYVKIFPNRIQLSVALIDNGNLRFFGVKRENDSLFLIENRNKMFEIGSISKVMTVSLMTGLVLEGKLALDDPIGKHMGLELKDGTDITLAHLANHTSGLPGLPPNLILTSPEPLNPYKNYDIEKLETYWTDLAELQREPGESYEYSNLGSGTLGYILTKATGRSYEELLQERIFKPYGMAVSTTLRSQVVDDLVMGLNPSGAETPNWDLNALMAAGGVLSSAVDMAAFALAQLDGENEEFTMTHDKTFTINERMSIALGWHIIKRDSGREFLWHNGGTGGYISSITLDPEHGTAAVILSNMSAFHPQKLNMDLLCFALLESLTK